MSKAKKRRRKRQPRHGWRLDTLVAARHAKRLVDEAHLSIQHGLGDSASKDLRERFHAVELRLHLVWHDLAELQAYLEKGLFEEGPSKEMLAQRIALSV